jgi:uncharacterized membrane protein
LTAALTAVLTPYIILPVPAPYNGVDLQLSNGCATGHGYRV